MITTEIEHTRAAWSGIAPGYDAFVTPTHMWLADHALRRADVRPGMSFLDVAAGSGALSIPAARLGARVLATDLSPTMLTHLQARARAEGLALVETRVMDGHALELDDATFDRAGSQFGVMLFPDMPQGLRELARVTRPGGRVLINAYGPPEEVEFFQFFVRAIRDVVPEFAGPPMHPPPLPFQLQDPERLRRELVDAGLTDVRVETVTETLEFRSAGQLWDWLTNSNPIVGAVLEELRLEPEQRAQIRSRLDDLLRARARTGVVALTNPVHIGIGMR